MLVIFRIDRRPEKEHWKNSRMMTKSVVIVYINPRKYLQLISLGLLPRILNATSTKRVRPQGNVTGEIMVLRSEARKFLRLQPHRFGRTLMFSTLKLKPNSDSVSPIMIAKSLEVSFFLSRTTSLTTPASPTAEMSGS